ncbi:hypothetical protein ABEF92_008646 [Exophiala dermatitidis]|uniref:Uncharacterized protein n=1 Tax=Exophiala dermatitidis (strain ATCC 34100 / CBS 525.76 / NIH/UT8656) TaxID=858893 RepID=H6C2V9_EXODN|nr:uncharacterized protein HMPREF1120_06835 [Exophiala dermatitidis NIH/UT8656]EHY58833.1 hypothetical protein HMPREF1120_06835 [Exophiala dermatitidis NIH/UT8656]
MIPAVTPQITATIKFIDHKLKMLDQVEDTKKKIISSGQKWGEKSSEKMERRIWVEICPFVLLGSWYITQVITATANAFPNDAQKNEFLAQYEEIFRFHRTVSPHAPWKRLHLGTDTIEWRHKEVSQEVLKPYIHDIPKEPFASYNFLKPSIYTELRASASLTRLNKLREVDKWKRPSKYYGYAVEAQMEWQMIKREKDRLDSQGDTYAEQVWPSHMVDDHLETLEKILEKGKARQPEDED